VRTFVIAPIVEIFILHLSRVVLALGKFAQSLLDTFIGFNKVEISAQAVGLIDVFSLLLPQWFVGVEGLLSEIRLEDLFHFGLDRLQPGFQLLHVSALQSFLLLLLVLFNFRLWVILFVIVLVVGLGLLGPELFDVGRVLLCLDLRRQV